MNALRHFPGRPDKVVGIVGGTRNDRVAVFLHLVVHIRHARHDEARAALCALRIVIDAALIEAGIRIGKTEGPHGRHGKPVFEFHIADSRLLKEIRVFLIH
jgi:hypothetical protein